MFPLHRQAKATGRVIVFGVLRPATLDALFPGQWFQLETGLAWNWHRTYDQSLGCYIQPDPLGLSDGPSVYGYVHGSPLMGVDREGLLILPPDPSGLPDGWVQDPTFKNPNGSKWRGPKGGCLRFDKGQPGQGGFRGKDHWHDCSKDKKREEEHLMPGGSCSQPEDVPEPAPSPEPEVPRMSVPTPEQAGLIGLLILGGAAVIALPSN